MKKHPIPDLDDPRYRITPTQQMLSSCLGAIATSIMVTPLDVVKVRTQAQRNQMVTNKCFVYCNRHVDPNIFCTNMQGQGVRLQLDQYKYRPLGHFYGTADAFVKIARTEGFSSLWSGLSATFLLAVPTTIVYWTTYQQLRVFIKDKQLASNDDSFLGQQPQWISAPVAGALARIVAVTLFSPLELVKTKMQSKKMKYREVGVALRSLIHDKGWLNLWRGLPPSLMRDVPFSAIYWTCYESYKTHVLSSEPSVYESFVGGAAAGSLAAFLTLPFDNVKTLRQISFDEREIHPNMKTILQRIYRQRGVVGLFTGLVPRVSKVAPACAIMIASYEYCRYYFACHNQKRAHLN